jgi:type 1 glutamine amidotransferase
MRVVAAGLILLCCSALLASQVAPRPRVFLLDATHLAEVRERVRSGDESLSPALAELERDAQRALRAGPFSVVDEIIPPDGDKHDYMSQAPYFWRDSTKPDGLPYIRRDGERNPEINKFPDHERMNSMAEAVETLSLAWWFTEKDAYAEKAAELVRHWFLKPDTRMNPNLQYGQGIPGITAGRGIGLIETRVFVQLIDSVGLLAPSGAWSSDDQRGLQEWFSQFLTWMLESKNGQEERAAKNNHGTYFDIQAACYALFVGKERLAREILRDVGPKRIAVQIEPDGRQPLELVRTKAWSYSIGNLSGLMSLARIAEKVRIDLWNYQTEDGRSIRAALDYLLPFALENKKWPHEQLGGLSEQSIFSLLRRAAAKYPGERYRRLAAQLPKPRAESREHLIRPQLSDKIHVLVITGGHGFQKEPFFKIFSANKEIRFATAAHSTTNASVYDRSDLLSFDVIVLYDMPSRITEEQKAKFLSLFDHGVGLVVLHHALVSYQQWPEYERIIGGRYPEAEGKSGVVTEQVGYAHDVDVPIKIVDREHPITHGISDFILHDEIYWGFRAGADVKPLFTTTHPKSGNPLAWTRSEKKSRIVFIQPGHGPSAFENDSYRRLLAQSIRWAAKH